MSSQRGEARFRAVRKLPWLGIGLAAIVWLAYSVIAALIFREGTLVEQVSAQEPIQVWMRFLILLFLMTLGGYAQHTVTKRKRAEQALREREETLTATLESTADGILVVDSQWRISYVNERFAQILGVPSEVLKSRDAQKLLAHALQHVEGREALESRAEEIDRTPQPTLDTLRLKDGRVFEQFVLPLVTRGEVAGRVVSIRDVTERKRAEEALRESEERYRSLLENYTDGVVVVADGQIVYANRRLTEMFGYTAEDARHRSSIDFVVPEERKQAAEGKEAILAGAPGQPTEYHVLAKDGSVHTVETSTRLIQHSGKPATLTVIHDITQRKRAEEALRESETKFRTTAETIAASVFILQEDKIRYANPAMETMSGYTRDELLAMRIDDLIHPDSRDLTSQLGPAPERGKETPQRYEVKILSKNGEEKWVDFAGSVFEFEDEPAVLGTAFDITERKRAEEALREQVRRDPLTGTLNHAAIVEELRNLLSSGTDGASHAVAMVDVDGLKAVNDTYGHQIGDSVLRTVAGALSRDGAIVGRYGGDEFVVLLPGANRALARRFRSDALEAMEGANVIDPETGTAVPVVGSIGLAIYPEDADTIADLIRLADSAMYAARRQRPAGTTGSPVRLRDDRAAKMVGELVPLLTSLGNVNDKLRLVAHRLSVGAGYDAVDFSLYGSEPGAPMAQNTFARASEQLVNEWTSEERSGRPEPEPEPHPTHRLFERTPRPVILNDPWNSELLLEPQRAILKAAGLRSVLVAPMIWQDQVIGSLGVASKREAAFTPRDAQFLAAVATQVTAIVRMATLLEELQSASTRLLEAQDETVILLAAAAEAHDHTTGLHLQGVRTLTEALARELGYGEDDARELGLAAVLHDIGKIRMPDSVLTSTGQLRDVEWELMKRHTIWGAEFLAGHPGYELATTIARSHHERWDGSGYPDGLSGDAIPEAATIVAVADSFDAIVNDRPYRKRRSGPQAVREIVACSGKQFDPKVVDALLRLHKRKALRPASPQSSRQAA